MQLFWIPPERSMGARLDLANRDTVHRALEETAVARVATCVSASPGFHSCKEGLGSQYLPVHLTPLAHTSKEAQRTRVLSHCFLVPEPPLLFSHISLCSEFCSYS